MSEELRVFFFYEANHECEFNPIYTSQMRLNSFLEGVSGVRVFQQLPTRLTCLFVS